MLTLQLSMVQALVVVGQEGTLPKEDLILVLKRVSKTVGRGNFGEYSKLALPSVVRKLNLPVDDIVEHPRLFYIFGFIIVIGVVR